MKKPLLIVLTLTAFLFSPPVFADDIAGAPTDGESVLLIYTSASPLGTDLKDAFTAAFSTIPNPPIVTELVISGGDGTAPGIYDELVAQTGQTELSDWCQVYDLRFREDKNNVGWTGQAQEDVLTMLGANSDWNLFDNYLDAGGHLYFQSDHHDFYIRNTNLFMFLNHIALQPITQQYASFQSDQVTISGFPATPMNFNTDYNNIVGKSFESRFPGGIDIGKNGSGRPLATFGTVAMALGYLSEDLKRNDGRVVVNFETNALYESALISSVTTEWLQNVYDFLSGCYRYNLTKTFTPDTLMVNQTGTFDITYSNEKQSLVGFTVKDTMPDCLEFISSTPAPTGNTGDVYWWDLPSVPTGGSGTISVQYRLTGFPPCN